MLTGEFNPVATALTVYGIETEDVAVQEGDVLKVATALTVYGIETNNFFFFIVLICVFHVATALTVYGIETICIEKRKYGFYWLLQQPLPFTVLKLATLR